MIFFTNEESTLRTQGMKCLFHLGAESGLLKKFGLPDLEREVDLLLRSRRVLAFTGKYHLQLLESKRLKVFFIYKDDTIDYYDDRKEETTKNYNPIKPSSLMQRK